MAADARDIITGLARAIDMVKPEPSMGGPRGSYLGGYTRAMAVAAMEQAIEFLAVPAEDPERRICRRYLSGGVMLCKVHGHPGRRCEDWEKGYQAALAADL